MIYPGMCLKCGTGAINFDDSEPTCLMCGFHPVERIVSPKSDAPKSNWLAPNKDALVQSLVDAGHTSKFARTQMVPADWKMK